MSFKRGLWIVLVGTICLSANAHASTISLADYDSLLEQYVPSEFSWESSVPVASEIKDQGRTPYCGLYAMATFLELWGKGGRPSYANPAIDTSYIAVGYNRMVSGGSGGTSPIWLAATTQIFGAVPKGATLHTDAKIKWPLPKWHFLHWKLMDPRLTDPILKGKWSHPTTGEAKYSGRDYLTRVLRMDFTQMVMIHTTWEEKFAAVDNPSEATAPPEYRAKSVAATAEVMGKIGQKIGIPMGYVPLPALSVYRSVRRHLTSRRPAYLSLTVGLTKESFAKHVVVAKEHLVPKHGGKDWMHAVVAVAHCDTIETRDPICRQFAPYMQRAKIKECIAIQNSWGEKAHAHGYTCLDPVAFARSVKGALVLKTALPKRN